MRFRDELLPTSMIGLISPFYYSHWLKMILCFITHIHSISTEFIIFFHDKLWVLDSTLKKIATIYGSKCWCCVFIHGTVLSLVSNRASQNNFPWANDFRSILLNNIEYFEIQYYPYNLAQILLIFSKEFENCTCSGLWGERSKII